MKKTSALLITLWLTGFLAVVAQPGNDQPLTAEFDKLLSEQFKPSESGCTALVARKGQVIYNKAFGMANLELNVPMQPNMVFRIGSITKQFTAIAILQLMEQGKLSLQDEITRFIPDYPTQGKKITIEHLLTHTSGIKSYTNMKAFGDIMRKDMTPTELIDFFKNQPMEFEPGTKWAYDNSGYFLLGYIIEKVSGKTYPQYVEEVFFKPLGMTSSYYGNDSKLIKNRAAGYQSGKEGGTQNADQMSMTLPYAAGSIQSTVGDLWTWHQAVHAYKLVEKETLQKAFTPYKLSDGKQTEYGYGWFLDNLRGSPMIWHGGGINGFLTSGIYLPEEDVFVAVFSNSTGKAPFEVSQRMAALTIGKPLPAPIQLDTTRLDAYVGVYEGPFGTNPKATFTVTREGNQLFEELTGGQKLAIFPETDTKFFFKAMDAQLEFIRDASGKVVKRRLTAGRQTSEAKKIN